MFGNNTYFYYQQSHYSKVVLCRYTGKLLFEFSREEAKQKFLW